MGAQRQGTLLVGDPDAPQVALGRVSAGRVWWWVRQPGRPRDSKGALQAGCGTLQSRVGYWLMGRWGHSWTQGEDSENRTADE